MTARHLALALVLAGCAAPLPPPPAGAPATVGAPQVSAGDAWTYRVRDGFTGLDRGQESYRVVDAAAGRIRLAVSLAGAAEEEQLYDAEWNWLARPATNLLPRFRYSPAYRAFDFPLSAGKRWRARVTATDPADGRRFPVTIDGVVLGWERVKVPAGEFDALKVRRLVYFGYWVLGERMRSDIVEHEWYAPAVKQAVRREASSIYYISSAGRPGLRRVNDADFDPPIYVQDDWLVYELASYSIRP